MSLRRVLRAGAIAGLGFVCLAGLDFIGLTGGMDPLAWGVLSILGGLVILTALVYALGETPR